MDPKIMLISELAVCCKNCRLYVSYARSRKEPQKITKDLGIWRADRLLLPPLCFRTSYKSTEFCSLYHAAPVGNPFSPLYFPSHWIQPSNLLVKHYRTGSYRYLKTIWSRTHLLMPFVLKFPKYL